MYVCIHTRMCTQGLHRAMPSPYMYVCIHTRMCTEGMYRAMTSLCIYVYIQTFICTRTNRVPIFDLNLKKIKHIMYHWPRGVLKGLYWAIASPHIYVCIHTHIYTRTSSTHIPCRFEKNEIHNIYHCPWGVLKGLCRAGFWNQACSFESANQTLPSAITPVCVAVCCSVLQCVAVGCSVLQCVAVCCSVLQYVVVYDSVLQWVWVRQSDNAFSHNACTCCSVMQYVAVRCRLLLCVALCCNMQCATVSCNSRSPLIKRWFQQQHIHKSFANSCCQISFHKRAINYRSLLWKMTYTEKASYASSPPCTYKCIFNILPYHTRMYNTLPRIYVCIISDLVGYFPQMSHGLPWK